jgi:pilus assembly protein CpaB
MIKGMTLPKGGNRLPLILGLVLGLVAAVLVVVYLSSAKDDSGPIRSGSGDGVPVVVAANDIAAGTRLSAEMLAVKNIPETDALVGAFGTTEGLTGQVTRVPVVAGEQVIQSKITSTDFFVGAGENPPLAFLIPPGMRAVSAEISSLIGAGGNIRPGDFVDVILIVEVKPEGADPESQGTSNQISATILQNVKVLAVGQEVTNPNAEASTNPDEAKDADETATSVTLLVTPTQGEVLSMSDVCGDNHGGRLSLSLRGPGDNARLPNRTEWANEGPPPGCAEVLGISALGG